MSAASAAYLEETWSRIGAPVVFGRGVRFFGAFAGPPALLGDPRIVPGDRVTHLRFPVTRR